MPSCASVAAPLAPSSEAGMARWTLPTPAAVSTSTTSSLSGSAVVVPEAVYEPPRVNSSFVGYEALAAAAMTLVASGGGVGVGVGVGAGVAGEQAARAKDVARAAAGMRAVRRMGSSRWAGRRAPQRLGHTERIPFGKRPRPRRREAARRGPAAPAADPRLALDEPGEQLVGEQAAVSGQADPRLPLQALKCFEQVSFQPPVEVRCQWRARRGRLHQRQT